MLDIPGLPLPDVPLPEPLTLWVLHESGALSRITVTGGILPVLPDGARLLTQEAYEELQAQMRQAHDDRLAEMQAAEEQQRREQYEDLRAVGLREETARTLSGYDPGAG
jgi:F0F1-type ATP synthase epsilon subunit